VPTVPSNPKCSTLGCKNHKARFSSLCAEHGGRDTFNSKQYNNTDKRRLASDKYSTAQWRTFRQIQLSQYPLCASCKHDGIITAAQHVDHIFPWQQIGEHAFTHNIYQSLCQSCHSSKTTLEQQGIFRRYGVRDYNLLDYSIIVANK
jgi:5-methylcytosine-specific restriction protein A